MKKVVLVLSLSLIGSDSQRELALMPTTGPPADVSVETAVIAEQVTEYFENARGLKGTAYLRRQWQKDEDHSGITSYIVTMEMSAVTVNGMVYEPLFGGGPLLVPRSVATIQGTIGQSAKVCEVNGGVDSCLFGSFKRSWVGPLASPPSFADWIKDGQVEDKTIIIFGEPCRSFSYTEKIGDETEEGSFIRIDQVWVRVESTSGECPIMGWDTYDYDTPPGTRKMVCYRRYDWR